MNEHPFIPTCPECGEYMVATSDEYISCPNMHGKLIPRCSRFHARMRKCKRVEYLLSLPRAEYTGYRDGRKKRFTIEGMEGYFHLDKNGPVVAWKAGREYRFSIVETTT